MSRITACCAASWPDLTAMVPALLLALGVKALLYQLAMSVVAVLFLELFNYVAHYGLLRRVLARSDGDGAGAAARSGRQSAALPVGDERRCRAVPRALQLCRALRPAAPRPGPI